MMKREILYYRNYEEEISSFLQMEFPEPGEQPVEVAQILKMRRNSPILKKWDINYTHITTSSDKSGYANVLFSSLQPEHMNLSTFLSLLSFMSEEVLSLDGILVIVGCILTDTQLITLHSLFPMRIDYWKEVGRRVSVKTENIRVRLGYPMKDTYTNQKVYLFTNICSNVGSMMLSDLSIQRKMCIEIKPVVASIRFRPPFIRNSTFKDYEYMDGEIRTICNSQSSSIAVRLIVRDPMVTRNYDLKEYEEMMNYYNTTIKGDVGWTFQGKTMSFDDCYMHHILSAVSLKIEDLY